MRYIRLKTVTSKILDHIIEDEETVFLILNTLQEKEIDCKIKLNSGLILDSARILIVGSDSFVCRAIKNNTSLRKTCKVNEIDSLEVNTETQVLAQDKTHAMSRWFMLDPADDLDIEEHEV